MASSWSHWSKEKRTSSVCIVTEVGWARYESGIITGALLTKSWGSKHDGQKHAISVAYVSHTFPQRCFVSQAVDRGCPETSGRLPTWNHLAWVLRTGREQRGLFRGDEERGLLASHRLWSCKHSSWLFSSFLPPAAFGGRAWMTQSDCR